MKFKFKCLEVGDTDFNFIVGKVYEFIDLGDCLATYDEDGFQYYMLGFGVEWEEIEDDNQCQN